MLNYESVKVNIKSKTVTELLYFGKKILGDAGIDNPKREAIELLSYACHLSKANILAFPQKRVESTKTYKNLIKKRAQRVPLQYLLGTEYFAGLKLAVGHGVLIPRPETELILELIKSIAIDQSVKLVADLGTGSGNLALALAACYPKWEIMAIDRSSKALYWARKNKKINNIKNVRFLQRLVQQGLPRRYNHCMDIVVSNPPYIIKNQLKMLQPEVRFEPHLALNGGLDGLDQIKAVTKAASGLLKPKGYFFCEIGIDQSKAVVAIFKDVGFKDIYIKKDWQEIPRIIYAQK